MARAGLPPSLAAIDPAAGQNVFAAFTAGVRTSSIALIGLSLPVLVLLLAEMRRRKLKPTLSSGASAADV
jgi:hypothetical protein